MSDETKDSVKNRTIDHIRRYRGRYAAATTAVAFYAILTRPAVKQWNEFLEEHNLTDTFYSED